MNGIAARAHLGEDSLNEFPLSSGQKATLDLSVRGLSKSFDGKIRALQNVDFQIPHEQAVALIGANGSGKSTLLRCCLRLIEPDEGSINLLGKEIVAMGYDELRRLRAKVGFVFQRHNLVPRLSVISNVLHGNLSRNSGPRVWFHSLAPRKERERAMHYLDQVGIAHLAERLVDQLSGGQSQRVAIARALMQEPRVVFADEPVASLDPKAGEEVMNLFIELMRKEGVTLLFTSHHLEHAMRYSDRVLGLRDGGLTLDAPTESLHIGNLKGIYD